MIDHHLIIEIILRSYNGTLNRGRKMFETDDMFNVHLDYNSSFRYGFRMFF